MNWEHRPTDDGFHPASIRWEDRPFPFFARGEVHSRLRNEIGEPHTGELEEPDDPQALQGEHVTHPRLAPGQAIGIHLFADHKRSLIAGSHLIDSLVNAGHRVLSESDVEHDDLNPYHTVSQENVGYRSETFFIVVHMTWHTPGSSRLIQFHDWRSEDDYYLKLFNGLPT